MIAVQEARSRQLEEFCRNNLFWHGCYTGTFDLIGPESYAHPAKMSATLCFRILEHLKELGLLKEGDTVLDPMAGTGMTAIVAGAKGYRAVTVELEERFVGFQHQNKEYAEKKLYRGLDWQIMQGDARKLSELLSVGGLISLTSPPYQTGEGDNTCGKNTQVVAKSWAVPNSKQEKKGYGDARGQIGNLKDIPLKTVTSPPYTDAQGHPSLGSVNNDNWGKEGQGIAARRGLSGDYGTAEGQIGVEKAESYLSAMKQVYQEVAKVSDVLAIVLKNPTRAGKLRRLDLDTVAILEQSGWRLHCRHRALLFEELEQADLFGEAKKRVRGRMSFFKRLSWQKGQPVAAWEDVLVCVRQ